MGPHARGAENIVFSFKLNHYTTVAILEKWQVVG